ncbi:MAG: sensor histidine kinase [Bryobacterales bacterium]
MDPERRKLVDELQASHELLSRRNEEISRLTAKVISAQEEERRRLAQELHDNINQRLAAVVMRLEQIYRSPASCEPLAIQEQISFVLERLSSLSKEVQDLSRRLYPVILEHLGLQWALESECRNFSTLTSIAVEFQCENCPPSLPPPVALCIYRIVQECLANVARHASASTARVELRGTSGSLAVCVRDSGIGFSPDDSSRLGLGLESMQERARHISAAFSIHSHPGSGTVIEVTVPLRVEKP